MIETTFNHVWFLFINSLFLSFSLSFFGESFSLLFFVLRFVFLEETGKTLKLVFRESVRELVNNSWYFKSLEEYSLLSLKKDIFWPLDISGQVSLWLDVSTNFMVSWSSLEEFRILGFFRIIFLSLGHGL